MASCGGDSSSCSFDFLVVSVREHAVRRRKGEETLAKWLKEGNGNGGFIIGRKCKGKAQKGEGRGSTVKGEQHVPSEPSDSKEEVASGAD